MNRSILLSAALAIAPATAAAATNQQVDPQYYKSTTGKQVTGGRDDGLFMATPYKNAAHGAKIPVLVGNGDGYFAFGPQYRETFAYGDDVGLICERKFPEFRLGSGANTACDTTCAALTPEADCAIGFANGGDSVVCSGNTADTCLCYGPDEESSRCGADFELAPKGVALIRFGSGVTLGYGALVGEEIAPDMDADSLDVGCDQTDNDGISLYGGMNGASGRPFVVGTDPAFQFCATVAVEDCSGTDDLHIGFRLPESVNPAFDNYLDAATIGIIGSSCHIQTETINDNAATTTTDTGLTVTDADGGHKYCVMVSDANVVTYSVDGTTLTAAQAGSFTFDTGDMVIPFFDYLHTADLAGEIDLRLWEVSYQVP